MKYVDNLLDWADSLFTQFTMESVNEALMLYIMASDVLGPRPDEVGDCGDRRRAPITYESVGTSLDGDERRSSSRSRPGSRRPRLEGPSSLAARRRVKYATCRAHGDRPRRRGQRALVSRPLSVAHAAAPDGHCRARPCGRGGDVPRPRLERRRAPRAGARRSATPRSRRSDPLGGRSFDACARGGLPDRLGRFGWSIVRQATPVFCVPVNADLLAYWDRVDDRLYKIRNCMDIDGQTAGARAVRAAHQPDAARRHEGGGAQPRRRPRRQQRRPCRRTGSSTSSTGPRRSPPP